MTVLAMNGVAEVPVHTALTVLTGGMVDTPHTLTSGLVAAQRVTKVNVITAFTLLTPTANHQRVAPVPDLTAV